MKCLAASGAERSELLPKVGPTAVEHIGLAHLHARREALAEQIIIRRIVKDFKLDHQTDYLLIERNLPVFLVFADVTWDKYGLVLYADVAEPDMAQLVGSNKCVVFHEARQKKSLVGLLQMPEQRMEHFG